MLKKVIFKLIDIDILPAVCIARKTGQVYSFFCYRSFLHTIIAKLVFAVRISKTVLFWRLLLTNSALNFQDTLFCLAFRATWGKNNLVFVRWFLEIIAFVKYCLVSSALQIILFCHFRKIVSFFFFELINFRPLVIRRDNLLESLSVGLRIHCSHVWLWILLEWFNLFFIILSLRILWLKC
jgi:hypothetical protein